ncbi:MAG: HAF repeat-containing protein [Deltaproteobacteria bacterium]|nr:HAF repeat-containing protein [Deltaproteobacteria bacterium]
MKKPSFCTILLVVAMFLASALSAVAAPHYTCKKLGSLGGTGSPESRAEAINADGMVVGSAITSSGDSHAFLYIGGVMQDLATLPTPYNVSSEASGINAVGQVVGTSYSSIPYHAFLWGGGVMQDLGTFPGGVSWSQAFGINGAGQVVGWAYNSSGDQHAFLYSGGVMKDLGALSTSSSAYGINDAGQVVGRSGHAFLYSSGGGMQDLGTLPGGGDSWANAINASAQVVGGAWTSSGPHAFLYSSSTGMQDLGTLGGVSSEAFGINTTGQVVGKAATLMDTAAFLYIDGVMYNLNSLVTNQPKGVNMYLYEAYGINDRGQIIAHGIAARGTDIDYNGAYLLTPTTAVSALDLLLLD